MTQKFKTACYVQVDDIKDRETLKVKLQNSGYDVCPCVTMGGEPYNRSTFVFNTPDGYIHICDENDLENEVNCGTNIDLFLALAGMREDTEFNHINPFVGGGMGEQWFIADKSYTDEFSGDEVFNGTMSIANFITCCSKSSKYWRKATTEEIIEHFKKKGE